jgi:hypothetical protein
MTTVFAHFSARVFQVTRCSHCGAPLDLPTVHFMCKHSFHQRYHISGNYLISGVSLILMTRNVLNAQKRTRRYVTYGISRMNGQNDRIYSVHIFGTQMTNLELWRIGLGKE